MSKLLSLLAISILFLADLAVAQAAPEQPPVGQRLVAMIPMFVIVFFIFYFLVIRPQNQRLKEQQNLLSSIKKGDKVVTDSGLVAKISSVEEQYVVLEASQNVKLKFEKDRVSKKL